MASTIKQRLRRYNGTDYDTIHLETQESQIIADYSKYAPFGMIQDKDTMYIPYGSTISDLTNYINARFQQIPYKQLHFFIMNSMSDSAFGGVWVCVMHKSDVEYGILIAFSYALISDPAFAMVCYHGSWHSPLLFTTHQYTQ